MSAVDEALEEFGLTWDQDLTLEENDRTEVSGVEDDTVRADSGELAIEGLSECLGIAVYDHSSGIGYAAHVKTADKDSSELAEYLSDFNAMLKADEIDYDNAEVMVAGVDYSDSITDGFLVDNYELGAVEDQSKKRGIAEQYAQRYFDESHVHWEVEDGKSSSIVMDLDEGAFGYDPAFDDR